VTFGPDSRRLASASEDKAVKLWDTGSGQELLTFAGHTDGVRSVAFSPDGQCVASASRDRTIKLWNANTGEELCTLQGHDAAVNEIVFSTSGDRLASAGDDKTVRVWDARTWQTILRLPGHLGPVMAVAFAPDGKRLASGSSDGTARLWDSTTGQEALALRRDLSSVFGVIFTPDGESLIATGQGRGTEGVMVWSTFSNKDSRSTLEETLENDDEEMRFLRECPQVHLRSWHRTVAACTKRIDQGNSDSKTFLERGEAYGHLGQYDRTASDYRRALEANPGSALEWYCYAVATLAGGDSPCYQGTCARMRERFGKTANPPTAHELLYAFLLVPRSPEDTGQMVQWGKCAARNSAYVHTLAQALYRDGQYDMAAEHFREAAKIAALRGDDLLFLAMTQQQLGKFDEARTSMTQAVRWIDGSDRAVANGGWWHWADDARTHRLRKEAEALFKARSVEANKSGR
jgi:tetratricopeptide (TPR) repeat protein